MSNQMVKSGLIHKLSEELGITQIQAEAAVNTFFDAITEGLVNNQRVEIRGFGSFTARQYSGYVGRNPRTGESVPVAPKVQAHYKPGKDMRDALNK
jgi:integration host factor subunit beta